MKKSTSEHIAIINEEMGAVKEKQIKICNDISDIKVHMAEVKTDVSWLKQALWVVAGSSIGGLITSLFNLIGK